MVAYLITVMPSSVAPDYAETFDITRLYNLLGEYAREQRILGSINPASRKPELVDARKSHEAQARQLEENILNSKLSTLLCAAFDAGVKYAKNAGKPHCCQACHEGFDTVHQLFMHAMEKQGACLADMEARLERIGGVRKLYQEDNNA